MFGGLESNADNLWLVFACTAKGCTRSLYLGIRPGVARFGRYTSIGSVERRMRCQICGGQRILANVQPDTRHPKTITREGPHPRARANLAPDDG